MARLKTLTANQNAFLDMLAASEIGAQMLTLSDDGYNILVGSTPDKLLMFDSYDDHPRILNRALDSTAAGRYQILAHYWDAYSEELNLSDFSPENQDKYALNILYECHAIPDIEDGNLPVAIAKCAHEWASLPGAGYDQYENKIAMLQQAFIDNGGLITKN